MELYKIEVFLRIGTPLLSYEAEKYWISCDEKLLHIKAFSDRQHIVIPLDNVIFFSATKIE